MEIGKIAFLETYDIENETGIMGVVMVTDTDTKPLEFRVTAPIKPSNFQKILYGSVLKEHISVELVAVPLLGAIKEEVDIIFVRDPLFLGANNKQQTRVVRVFNDNDKASKIATKAEEIKNFNAEAGKVYIETSKKFEDELPQLKDMINGVAESRDLIEPFERLKLACEQVYQKRTRE
ncbi:MAG: hypothetical protein JEY94_15615 [Melioribacteraceae bacterium]|nr:hypothetical protein [Melioribacteraceae bacterium]